MRPRIAFSQRYGRKETRGRVRTPRVCAKQDNAAWPPEFLGE